MRHLGIPLLSAAKGPGKSNPVRYSTALISLRSFFLNGHSLNLKGRRLSDGIEGSGGGMVQVTIDIIKDGLQ